MMSKQALNKRKNSMYVLRHRISIYLLVALLIGIIFINLCATPKSSLAQNGTSTPTKEMVDAAIELKSRPALLAFLPTTQDIMKVQDWATVKTTLNSRGNKLVEDMDTNFSPPVKTYGGTLDYGQCVANKPCTDIQGNFDVQNGIIESVEINYYKGSNFPYETKVWNMINPSYLVAQYGSPNRVFAMVDANGSGTIGTIILIWEERRAAAYYSVYLESTKRNNVSMCLTPNLENAGIITSRGNVIDAINKKGRSYPFLNMYKEFDGNMFIGISRISDVGDTILKGNCLETSANYWFP